MSETSRTRQNARIENLTDSFHRYYGRWKNEIKELRLSFAKCNDRSTIEEIVGAIHQNEEHILRLYKELRREMRIPVLTLKEKFDTCLAVSRKAYKKAQEFLKQDETTTMVQSGDGIEDQIPLPPVIPTSTEPISKEEEKEGEDIIAKEEKDAYKKAQEFLKKDETTTMVQSGDGIVDQIPLPPEIPTSTEPIPKEEEKGGENVIAKERKDANKENPGETDRIPISLKLEGPEEEKKEGEGKLMPNSALNIRWSFGFNQSIPVENRTDKRRILVMYTSSHADIIYDNKTNTQSILQAHANSISCTPISKDKKWLVTADKSKDNTVWNTRTHYPVWALFSASAEGMEATALSQDAKYLAIMCAGDVRESAIWDWTVPQDKPLAYVILNPGFSGQNYIFFCEKNMSYIISNSEHQVILYQWKDDKINYFAPPLTGQDFHITMRKYSQSIIVADAIHVLTERSVGNLVVWDTNIFFAEGEKREIANKKAAKITQPVTCGITVLTLQATNPVIGDALRNIGFYDQRMTPLHCFNGIGLGPVRTISFYLRPEEESNRSLHPEASTMKADNIVFPDLIISTLPARCGLVHVVKQEVQMIVSNHGKPIPAITTHSLKPFLATGSHAGKLKVYNYLEEVSIASCSFDKKIIDSCIFSHDDRHLALGFYSGGIRVLDSFILKLKNRTSIIILSMQSAKLSSLIILNVWPQVMQGYYFIAEEGRFYICLHWTLSISL